MHPSITRNRRRLSVAVAVVAVSLLAVVPATAKSDVSGDPDALSYYQQVVSDYQLVPGARVVEYGLFFLHYNGGTSVDFRWGGNKPAGFKAAKAVIDYWLDDGKIVGYLATVTARDVPRLRILVAAGNVYVSTTTCWERSGPGAAPFGTGERLLVSDSNGRFEKLKQSGRSTVVTFHYTWLEGTQAKEVSTMSATNPPVIRSKIVTRGDVKIKVSLTIRPLKRRPSLPLKTRSPLPPEPTPFCKKKT